MTEICLSKIFVATFAIPIYRYRKIMLKPFYQDVVLEAGCDEAGRGCYAGPVFAAAVILPVNFAHPDLNDSKQVTAEKREVLKKFIKQNALAYSIAMVDNEEIDQINILKASFKAMHMALDKLKKRPKFLLIDGNRFMPYKNVKHECIIKGDGIYASIAAASILAKTARDSFMRKAHKEFPQYNWKSNKGYGTAEHRAAIDVHGLCRHHRKSFNILNMQMNLFDEDAEAIVGDTSLAFE